MKVTIEWSKEDLEQMIREKLQEAHFNVANADAIQWKTRPLHVVIQAVQSEVVSQQQRNSIAPKPGENFEGAGKLPADMFPPEAELDALSEAVPLRHLYPNEKREDPRGENK